MLEVRHLTKLYAGIPAVADVSFCAPAGEVTGYLGPNGSGKSTTIKMIAGLIEPSEGEILFQGERIDLHRVAYRQRLGYVPEEPHLYPHLTGLEYLEMVSELRCLPKRSAFKKINEPIEKPTRYLTMTALLLIGAIWAKRQTVEFAKLPYNRIQFDDVAPAEIYALDFRRDSEYLNDDD